MNYTVKQLAKLSGVSVRTLHWYDEIGLLKPAYQGVNRYRYYGETELLLLQQILFYRELGFGLGDIQKLLSSKDFDILGALKSHRIALQKEINTKISLLTTLDKTIKRLKGDQEMTDAELYRGFDPARQKEYETYLVEYRGTKAEDLLFQSKIRTAKWGKDQWDTVKNQGDAIHKALAVAIENGLSPESEMVQKIIHDHYLLTAQFYDVTQEVYVGLTHLYADHPDFKKFFDVYHPQMIDFIGKAMRYYAQKNLK